MSGSLAFLHPLLCHCRAAAAIAGLYRLQPQPPPPPPKVVAPPPARGRQSAGPRPAQLICACPTWPPARRPVRVGVILPFTSSTAATRDLAAAMLKAAELAMFDAGNRNILLMTADEGSDAGGRRGGASSFWPRARKSLSGPCSGRRCRRWRPSRATAACRCWPSPPRRAWRAMASIC